MPNYRSSALNLLFGTVAASTAGLGIVPMEAQAALLGDTVRANLSSNSFTILDETELVVDPGLEFSRLIGDGSLSLDVKSDSFDIIYDLGSFPSVGGPTTWVLSDLDWVSSPGIVTGVSLVSGDASLISGTSFTDNSITVDLMDFSSPPNPQINTWSFAIETDHGSTSVPEPVSVFSFLVLGAITTGTALKKRVA